MEPVFTEFALHHETGIRFPTGAVQSFGRVGRCFGHVLGAQLAHLSNLECGHLAISLLLELRT